jgi:acetoin utilization deacetylase AcuC-like enzyme
MITIYPEQHELHDTSNLIVSGNLFETEELPQRAEILRQAIEQAQIGEITSPVDHGLEPVLKVHDPDYLHFLQTIYTQYTQYYGISVPALPATFSGRQIRRKSLHPDGLLGYYAFGTGTPILSGTWQAAYWSAQSALSAADVLLADEPNVYALCRPPGHHAATAMYGGFCYLNNAAVAARYLQANGKDANQKVAILDFDYHHGNGTQEIFYQDDTVLYCSLHANPDQDYPYFWGAADELGSGAGIGANRNWPLPVGTSDKDFLNALDEALTVIAAFTPAYLVVSAGWDIRAGDPAGGFILSRNAFPKIGRQIASLDLPVLIIQEGGYLLDEIGACAVAFLSAFT